MTSPLQYPPSTEPCYYVSGPISGDIAANEKKFEVACIELRERGYKIVSPVEVCSALEPAADGHAILAWDWYMRRDIEAMVADGVGGIIMLPGWENSRGAKLELQVAKALNYVVTTLGECLARPVKVTL